MDKKKPSKDERGNVRYLWVLVGAYLLYLAWQQLQLILQGEAVKTGDVILCVVSGAVFAAVGVWVILREWRAWRYAQTRKDNPEGDASEEGKTSADALKSLVAGLAVRGADDSDAPEVPKLRIDADKGDSADESEGDDEDPDDDNDAPDDDDDESDEDDDPNDDDESDEDDDESDDEEDPDEDDDEES